MKSSKYKIIGVKELSCGDKYVEILFEGEERIHTYNYINKYDLYNEIRNDIGFNLNEIKLEYTNCYIGYIKENKDGEWEEEDSFSTYEFKHKYGFTINKINYISLDSCLLPKKFYISGVNVINPSIITNCKFNNLKFSNIKFKHEIHIHLNKFYKEFELQNCHANAIIQMYNNKFFHICTIYGNKFDGVLSIMDSEFEGDLDVENNIIEGLSLYCIEVFKGNINFINNKFYSHIYFNNSKIDNYVVFRKNHFNGNIKFEELELGNLLFNDMNFEREVNLISSKINTLTIVNSRLKSNIFIGKYVTNLAVFNNIDDGILIIKNDKKKVVKSCKSYKEEYYKLKEHYRQNIELDREYKVKHLDYLNEVDCFEDVICETLCTIKDGLRKNNISKEYEYIYFWYRHYEIMPKNSSRLNLKYITKLFLFELSSGFGMRPLRLIIVMIFIILMFAIGYYLLGISDLQDMFKFTTNCKYIQPIYFSCITFLTIGYGDVSAWSPLTAILTSIEGFFGVFFMSYLGAIFAGKLLR